MEKKIRFLIQQWKNEDVNSELTRTGVDSNSSSLEKELETIWQKAGQYKSKSFEPDIEANWEKFQSKIKAESVAEEGTPVRRLIPRSWLVAASVAVVLGISWWIFSQKNSNLESKYLATNRREIKKIELPDHTVVWLNHNSELNFDPQLNHGKIRKVTLRGEAYFEVQADPQRPFQIETPHGLIEVLGTSFNVRALKTEPRTEVQVTSGLVALMGKGDHPQRIEIPANFIGYIPNTANQPNKTASTDRKVFASTQVWRTRKIELSGRTLAEAREIMRRYSNYRLEFSDPALADCIFTWTFQLDKPEASLRLLASTGFFHLEKTSATVFRLEGKACPK